MTYRIIILALTLIATFAEARTEVSGEISGAWNSAGSPYVVTGNLTILPDQKLKIGHDVEVQFSGPFYILVQGTLIVDGDGGDDEGVKFMSAKGNDEGWGGIRFENAGSDCELKSLSLTDARATVVGADLHAHAISSNQTDLVITNCAMSRCGSSSVGGTIAINGGKVTLTNVAIADCKSKDRNGIIAINNAEVSVSNIALSNNQGIGLLIENKSDVKITNAAISEQSGEEGWGIHCRNSQLSMSNTAVSDNSAGGLKVTDSSIVAITTSAIADKNGLESDESSEVTVTLSDVNIPDGDVIIKSKRHKK